MAGDSETGTIGNDEAPSPQSVSAIVGKVVAALDAAQADTVLEFDGLGPDAANKVLRDIDNNNNTRSESSYRCVTSTKEFLSPLPSLYYSQQNIIQLGLSYLELRHFAEHNA